MTSQGGLEFGPIYSFINEITFFMITKNRAKISSLNFTLGSHSGVSVRRASGQDSCSEELGRLAVPQQRKWRAGSAARHDRRFVAVYSRREREFAYQIPRFI